ncbi:hypothetical protein PGANDO_1622, partial [Porphyromonas gingivalis]
MCTRCQLCIRALCRVCIF